MLLPVSTKNWCAIKNNYINKDDCFILQKISHPELVYLNLNWKAFSIYKPNQIFFVDDNLADLLKCYYDAQKNIGKCHLQRAFTTDDTIYTINCPLM